MMYIARQPIFNRLQQVYAYELLYRKDATANHYQSESPILSTATVVSGLFELKQHHLIDSTLAFINVDEEFLFSDALLLIPPTILVIELLENISFSNEVVSRIRHLKQLGYRIAMDDFNQDLPSLPILDVLDIIKVDLLSTPIESITQTIEYAKQKGISLLAEKVETPQQYHSAKVSGFDYFQGYFFCKPEIAGNIDNPKANVQIYLQIMLEIQHEEPSIQEIARLIESDVTLAYRLLKVIGSRSIQNQSIIAAIMRVGLLSLHRWIYLLMLQDLTQHKPPELLRLALFRARFSEQLAKQTILSKDASKISLMCLLSVIDAIMDTTMEEALTPLSLDQNIHQALVQHTGPYSDILHLVVIYEQDSSLIAEYISNLNLNSQILVECYIQAIQSTENLYNQLKSSSLS